MQAATCRKILVSSRAAVGWLSVLAPNLIGRAWRMRSPLDKDVKFAVRLFGIRNTIPVTPGVARLFFERLIALGHRGLAHPLPRYVRRCRS